MDKIFCFLFIIAVLIIIILISFLIMTRNGVKTLENEANKICTRYLTMAEAYEKTKNNSPTNRVIAKIIEIMTNIFAGKKKNIISCYVGDLSTVEKNMVEQYFRQFGDESTDTNSMWWSRYNSKGILDTPEDDVCAKEAVFICFKKECDNEKIL